MSSLKFSIFQVNCHYSLFVLLAKEDPSKVAFNPEYGLFTETEEERMVYPNPDSEAIPDFHNHLDYFEFIGRIVGKVCGPLCDRSA